MKEVFPAADSAYFTAFAVILVLVLVVVKAANGAKVEGELDLASQAVAGDGLATIAFQTLQGGNINSGNQLIFQVIGDA